MSYVLPLKAINTLENSIISQKGMFWKCFPGLVIPEIYTIKKLTIYKFFITLPLRLNMHAILIGLLHILWLLPIMGFHLM